MTIGKATINHLRTGVPGLDEVLGGGLPEFSCNLIAGPPRMRQDNTGASDDACAGDARTSGALLHRTGRAANQNAALPAAIRLL